MNPEVWVPFLVYGGGGYIFGALMFWDWQGEFGPKIEPRHRLLKAVLWPILGVAWLCSWIVRVVRVIWNAAIHNREPDR